MKRYFFIAVLAACIGLTASAQTKAKVETNGQTIEVQIYTPEIIRVIKHPSGREFINESFAVTAKPANCKASVKESSKELSISTAKVKVSVSKADGTVSFSDAKGKKMIAENAPAAIEKIDWPNEKNVLTAKQSWKLEDGEAIYGLTIHENGKLSQRGSEYKMIQNNCDDYVPFFQSVKGYGLYWDNASPTKFIDNEDGTSFDSEIASGVDYYFLLGGSIDGTIARMRELTGKVPMIPLWGYGFMQSRERYKSQAEALTVLNTYREQQIPIDVLIQDWQYWDSNYLWNAMEFLNPEFPNGKRFIQEIHDQNAHILISIWQSFGPMTKQYADLEKIGALYDIQTWPQSGLGSWPPKMKYPSGVRVYDPYNPEARDIYWNYLNEGLFKLGVDGWWMDSTEPDHHNFKDSDFEQQTYLGSWRKVRNAFPLECVKGVYDHQRQETSDKRVFILTRSGFAGQQRYASNVWSGDVQSTWTSLRAQIPAGLNYSMTGNPHFNSDLGGFFCNGYNNRGVYGTGPSNPKFRELYVRWAQYGVFTPMMRSHGADTPREIYLYGKAGEPVYDALVSAVKLRYSLLPYIYSTAWEVTSKDASFMRALAADFVADRNTWDMKDEYMFGKAFLVAPIVEPQYTDEKVEWSTASVDFTAERSAETYLPAGAKWYDFFSGKAYNGGQTISQATTLASTPVFVRAGSIVPIGPDVQYAAEKAWDSLEIRVYPGANGSFTLYEDAGDGYAYENGEYSEIPMTWSDGGKTLTIGARKGSYPGMIMSRTFTVKTPDGKTRSVDYNGAKVVVKM